MRGRGPRRRPEIVEAGVPRRGAAPRQVYRPDRPGGATRPHSPRTAGQAVGVAVAATVQHGRVVQAATLGWDAVDLGALASDARLPLLIGNDATLGGGRRGPRGRRGGRGDGAARHDRGGGRRHPGRRRATGQRARRGAGRRVRATSRWGARAALPPCGATGCWDLAVDGRAIAQPIWASRRRTIPDLRGLAAIARTSADAATAAGRRPYGRQLRRRSLAGLINALDPDVRHTRRTRTSRCGRRPRRSSRPR
ncbi:hypothetical protein [Nonomuraea dietziae]|uniref:hypothetical protein n=1 Tax=Nonomuraea dietziae TaxID=65515 RepID=UPI0031DD822A